MKIKRNLSGIYYRYKNPETEETENRCFEDLPSEAQDLILNAEDCGYAKRLAKMLADTLNEVGNAVDIIAE